MDNSRQSPLVDSKGSLRDPLARPSLACLVPKTSASPGGRAQLLCGPFLQDGRGNAELAFAFERTPACKHLVQHSAKRKMSLRPFEILSLDLFWRHVLKYADNNSLFSHGSRSPQGGHQRGHAGEPRSWFAPRPYSSRKCMRHSERMQITR